MSACAPQVDSAGGMSAAWVGANCAESTSAQGEMPLELREKIERALEAADDVERYKKSHKKGPGLVQPRCVPLEDLVHEKAETIRKGSPVRVHYRCSNPKCEEPIRYDKWDAHVTKWTSDRHLQEPADDVLERSMNSAPDSDFCTRESRQRRVLSFMEQRHFLAVARQHGEV